MEKVARRIGLVAHDAMKKEMGSLEFGAFNRS